MKLSLEWIKDYTNYSGTLEDFMDGMTMSGSKVETFEIEGQGLSNIVTGYIKECGPHPNADKLSICQVDVGQETLQIICGAPNVAQGQKVIVALTGAVLAQDFKIKKTKLRGEVSNGMICSIDELGFSFHDFPNASPDGIYVLPQDTEIGVNALDVIGLGQEIIEFEITSNRPDCLSVEGLAREAAATFANDFTEIKHKPQHLSELKSEDLSSITVEASDLCSTFIGRIVSDVKIEESPVWMQKRLRAAGMRPINNIVDITNFVMLSLGQPMHAYDLDFLVDNSIIVRRAQDKEEMILLDGRKIEMNPDNLVIADNKRAIGLAGVMGAENSEVRDSTKTILFEAATFDKASVRATAKEYNIRSEASLRFEKGLPAQNAQRAMDYACYLIELLGCGKVSASQIKVAEDYPSLSKVEFNPDTLNRIAGLDLSIVEINNIFKSLEIKTEFSEKSQTWFATIPYFRSDLEIEADLSEEIARIYGYDRIESRFSTGNTPTLGGRSKKQLDIENIHHVLNGCGAYEVYTYTFFSPKAIKKLDLPQDHPLSQELTILNPLGEEYSKMRTTILPSLLNVIEYNLARDNSSALFYEIGKTFHPRGVVSQDQVEPGDRDQVLPDEREHLAIAYFDQKLKKTASGYYLLKGVMEELFRHLGVDKFSLSRVNADHPYLHPGQAALIYLPDYEEAIGYIGTIHPHLQQNFDIVDGVFVLDLDLKLLLNSRREKISFKALAKYPAITRDLAFVMDRDYLVAEIQEKIKEEAGSLLESIAIFDVYQGIGVAKDKKSVAFSLVFRSSDRTLNDEEINPIVENIIQKMADKDIVLRS